MDSWKKLSPSVWMCRKMKPNKTAMATKMQCHATVWNICNISHFSSLCVCTRVCLRVCLCVTANEKVREKIWWIVSYMETISSAVIYGVNNGVYSHACSPVVFLFVVGWQKYYSQTTHLLHPILTEKAINPVLVHICTIWHHGRNRAYVMLCAHMHSNSGSVCKHNYKPNIIFPM